MDELHIFPDAETLSAALAAQLAAALTEAVRDYGEASIALAGGSTPQRSYELLAALDRQSIPWQSVHFFWSDERCVPPDHPHSNYRMAQHALLSRIPAWQEKIHRMRGEVEPAAEAQRYSALLQELFADQLGDGQIVFDVVLLGMGSDGHTASLFPHSPALEGRSPCLAVEAAAGNPPGWRLSLSLPVLNAARRVFIAAAGAEKSGALRAVREGLPAAADFPVARVQPREGELHWFVDAAALPGATPRPRA